MTEEKEGFTHFFSRVGVRLSVLGREQFFPQTAV